ncbi:MAG TPA: multicopper oxidase family protein [Gammaproteobacteria bacterium]|nr:multicopper oxidase family protein [Gammaproteobacteria bacterium]
MTLLNYIPIALFCVITSLSILLPGCSQDEPRNEGLQDVVRKSARSLQVARDINPDPRIVEINLEAKESTIEIARGVFSRVYTYNGMLPGPVIKTNIGDTLIVHFTNNLPEPTTIHWHGLRVPADMDGSTLSQHPVQPGQSFRYEFMVSDPSLFWYHPHVRTDVQVEMGLAGALLVSNDTSQQPHLKPLGDIKQDILILDDIRIEAGGEISLEDDGRLLWLVNGLELPKMEVVSGEPLRWRLVNIANERNMRIEVPGHKLIRVGGDGGLLEKAITDLDDVTLVPGERADIVLTPVGKPGSELTVYRKNNGPSNARFPLMTLIFIEGEKPEGDSPENPVDTLTLPETLRTIKAIDTTDAIEQTFEFSHGTPDDQGNVSFLINGKTFADLTPQDAPDAEVGETQIWNLVNTTAIDHPFHLHGFFFQVLETITRDAGGRLIETTPAAYRENKDTVDLPRRPGISGTSTTVRVAVSFDVSPERTKEETIAYGGLDAIISADLDRDLRGHSGGWLFHCHILPHAVKGMMSYVEVGGGQ